MTTSPYNGPASLADRFENLKRDGWLPSQAVEILATMYVAEHFHTPFKPGSLGFRLKPDGNLVIDSDAGELDPGKIPTRDPGILDPAPVPFKMPPFDLTAAERERERLLEAAMVRNKPRTFEQYLAENPGALKGVKELDAAKWLAAKLSPDDEVTRETHRDDCVAKFGLSEIGYSERVWYAARYLAELPERRRSGPTKGPRKAGAAASRKPHKSRRK